MTIRLVIRPSWIPCVHELGGGSAERIEFLFERSNALAMVTKKTIALGKRRQQTIRLLLSPTPRLLERHELRRFLGELGLPVREQLDDLLALVVELREFRLQGRDADRKRGETLVAL